MLSPIYKVPCWPGLAAAFDLQVRLAKWLCEPGTTQAQVTESGIRALCATIEVQDWLWQLLSLKSNRTPLRDHAQRLASQSATEKCQLRAWIEKASEISVQFGPSPPSWLKPPIELPNWLAFKELMEAFYGRFKSFGLPFDASGNPTASRRVTYAVFLNEFKQLHGDQACVMCGGYLSKPQVDHWIAKAAFPILSVAPDNILPICYECNVQPCKGDKPVFTARGHDAFAEWFHPFHRPGYGRINPAFDKQTLHVRPAPTNAGEAQHVANLDALFQLSDRWTRSYKAREKEWRTCLRQMIAKGYFPPTEQAIAAEAQRRIHGLVEHSPNYGVDHLFYTRAQDPVRLGALVADLSL